MSHQSLVLLIKEYIKKNPQVDIEDIVSVVTYIETNPHCFERIKQEGARHIASNMLLFSPDYKRMLCLRLWNQINAKRCIGFRWKNLQI
jgi:hypothetical protein